jgi:hypothetical protein
MSVTCVLAFAALIVAIVSAIGKAPLWVSVLLLCVAMLLSCMPR